MLNPFSEAERASRERSAEIDRVAADLIRSGTPPFEAHRRAADHVDRRRQMDAIKRSRIDVAEGRVLTEEEANRRIGW